MNTLVLLFLFVEVVTADILSKYYQSNLLFTQDMYKVLLPEGHFLVSPASLHATLAIVAFGGQRITQTELFELAHFPSNATQVSEIYVKLGKEISAAQSRTLYRFVIYTNLNVLNSPYITCAPYVFNATIVDSPLRRYSTSLINTFIEFSNGITFQHQLEFATTLETKFRNAGPSSFHMTDSEAVIINMLNIKQEFGYHYNELLRAEFLEMPFTGNEVTFTIVLPEKVGGLPKLEQHISELLLEHPYETLNISVTIPKPWDPYGYSVKSYFMSLGTEISFLNYATFSGISDDFPFTMNDVLHSIFFDFAKATSEDELPPESSNPQEIKFVANRPFMYYMKHRILGVVAIGKYADP